MANDSHLRGRRPCFEVLAVLAIAMAFATPASAQQGPSPAAAAPGRIQDSPRARQLGDPGPRRIAVPARPAGAGRDRGRGRGDPQGTQARRQLPVRDRDPEGAVEGGRAAVAARRRIPARGVRDPARQGDRPGLRGGRRPPHRCDPAVRGPARGRAAADHARGVRRVRGGGPQVARVPRGDEEARHRGPQPGRGRRLVGGPLRQRAARGQGQAAGPRPLLGPLRSPRQLLRPARRELRRGRGPQPQGTPPRRGLRRHPPAPAVRQLGARVRQGDPHRGQAAGGRRSPMGRASPCRAAR